MENMRLLLLASLGFVMLLLWQAWQNDYNQKAEPYSQEADNNLANSHAEIPTSAAVLVSEDLPVANNPSQTTITPTESEPQKGQRISVETDVVKAIIDTHGGDIRNISLKDYPVEMKNKDISIVMFDDTQGRFYVSQGGFLSEQAAPNHHSIFQTDATDYSLQTGKDSVQVILHWSDANIQAEKTFTFHRGQYLIDVNYKIKNIGTSEWRGRVYEQLQRKYIKEGRSALPTYTGGAVSTPEKRYEKVEFDEMAENPLSRDGKEGWLAMVQHYFVSAILPKVGVEHHFYSKVLSDDRYIIGTYGPQWIVKPGETQEETLRLYSGPKVQKRLAEIAPNLELTKDYGVLWFLAKPLFQVMDFIHSMIGNWGWAIVLVTILIKLIFYPLSAMGYKSMAKMRKFQPRMATLKERYGNDKAKLNKAMMDLYKEEKINPLGGCFPILIQIPVFLALYWTLLESVEIRQAPFILWIKDLSVADPFFVLPLIMGISMFVQQKLNPAPIDPIQAKVMQYLPIIFTVFFAFFPAGLVLYWVANNILSIAQQWMITRQIEGTKTPA